MASVAKNHVQKSSDSPSPRAKQEPQLQQKRFLLHTFDDILMQKGISNTLFGSICLKNNIDYCSIDCNCNYCEQTHSRLKMLTENRITL